MRIVSPTGKRRLLGAIHANAGIRAAYRRRLDALIERMAAATEAVIAALWRHNPPRLAQDESTGAGAADAINRLRRDWEREFASFAAAGARGFVRDTAAHADRSFAAQLRKLGFTVRFKLTAAQNDVVQAAVAENVSLIKSIPEQYLTQVQSIVMAGVQTGRDMHVIAQGLQDQLGVTKRRAATIARDQSNKATAATERVRREELELHEAVWLHSGGGKHPRPTHVKMDGKIYDVRKGMWDPAVKRYIWPGTEISCRCRDRVVVPGV